MTKIRTSCVIHVYYVLDNDRVDGVAMSSRAACVAKLDLLEILLDTERTNLFSSDVIASHNAREI